MRCVDASGALEVAQLAVADERDAGAVEQVGERRIVTDERVVLDPARPVGMRRPQLVAVDGRVHVDLGDAGSQIEQGPFDGAPRAHVRVDEVVGKDDGLGRGEVPVRKSDRVLRLGSGHAQRETEVDGELQAQIERASLGGFDVRHLASPMGTLQLRADFYGVYLELAVDFGLPLRMGPAGGERVVGFPYRDLAAAEGVVYPDHLVVNEVGARRHVERVLFDLRPGVTEVYLHPAVDADELRASYPDWAGRVEDHAFLCEDPSLPDLVERAGATLIGYRELRDLQRAA